MKIFVNSHPEQNLNNKKQSQDSKPLPRSRAECAVERPLILTLHASRLFGVAPITFKKKLNSVYVSVSPPVYLYSWLLLFAFHASIISGLVLDFYADSEVSVRVRSTSAALAWIAEVLIVAVVLSYGVYNGPERMTCMIHCLNVIEKVNSEMHKHLPGKCIERTVLVIGIMYLLIGFSLYMFDFYTFVYEALLDGKDMKVLCLYFTFYLEFMATFPLELQFLAIVMKTVSAQKAVNNALTELVCQIDSRGKHISTVKVVDYPSDNANFDPHETLSLFNITKDVDESASQISNKDTELVRCLILSYGAICDVVRQLNDSNAIVLNLLLLSLFLHLVVSPYYLISFWASTKHWAASAMLQIFMFTFHTLNMMIIVEPAHRSTEEMENTQALLARLTRRVTSPREPLFHELDLFCKQIVLNPVSFTPMGICTLARPVIATIFGGVTTYLVIILQFKALDKQSW